jgi:hypothetical protein
MAIETNIDKDKEKKAMDSKEHENVEIDGIVDIEEEIMCDSIEIKKIRKMNSKKRSICKNMKNIIMSQNPKCHKAFRKHKRPS